MTDLISSILLSALVLLVLGGALFVFNRRVQAYYQNRPSLRFRRQVLQLVAILITLLLAILLLPLTDELRGHLLSLLGLIISATIALSSTTLVGNMMAGIMLKTVGNFKPGDYITVGDHFGRVSEMDLLHTEIQTEQRDLTTLPNLYMVTNPVRVMHTSGTILSVDLSLGYDVSRHKVEKLLIQAATDTGLESPYVQIRELGDFSVSYAVSGLLNELNQVLGKRRELRARTIDVLHDAGIEIVSPTFMNTRAFSKDDAFIARTIGKQDKRPKTSPDSLVFDKAEKAESVEKLREKLQEQEERLARCDVAIKEANSDEASAAAAREKETIEHVVERLKALIATKEASISGD